MSETKALNAQEKCNLMAELHEALFDPTVIGRGGVWLTVEQVKILVSGSPETVNAEKDARIARLLELLDLGEQRAEAAEAKNKELEATLDTRAKLLVGCTDELSATRQRVKELEAAMREEIKNYCIHCAKGVPMSTEPDLQDRVHNLASPGDPDYRVCKSAPFKRVLAILERKGESQ